MIALRYPNLVEATPIVQSLRSRLEAAESGPWPDRPVSIALVITDLDVGGAERALVELATRLDRRRWQPSVVCLGPAGEFGETLGSHDIPVAFLALDRRSPIKAVVRVARALQAIEPELVQSFLFHANIATKLAGRPRVVGGIRVAERRNRWHLGMERITQRLSCGSICVSEGVRRHAVETGHLDPNRLVVIPNGIDPSRFDGIAPAIPIGTIPADHRVMLFVGRLEPQKGVATLLDAFAQVAPDRPGWSLAIVGDGPARASLHARSESSPILRDRVCWLGRRRDVPALMAASEIVVLPSLWEGMPNVVLEAMAASKAVIGTRVEGTEDLVVADGPERTGWLADPGDVRSLVDVLRIATSDSEDRRTLGARGRDRVERRFSLDRVVAAYETVWAACLGFDRDSLPVRVEFGLKPVPPPGR